MSDLRTRLRIEADRLRDVADAIELRADGGGRDAFTEHHVLGGIRTLIGVQEMFAAIDRLTDANVVVAFRPHRPRETQP